MHSTEFLCRSLLVVFIFEVLCSLQGCSFSDSSKSFSDSSSAIFSSGSSSPDGDNSYETEVAEYTAAYVKSTSEVTDYKAFFKGISDIAAEKGINNWPNNEETYKAIGMGLRKANVKGFSYDTYKRNLAGSNVNKMQSIEDGYDD